EPSREQAARGFPEEARAEPEALPCGRRGPWRRGLGPGRRRADRQHLAQGWEPPLLDRRAYLSGEKCRAACLGPCRGSRRDPHRGMAGFPSRVVASLVWEELLQLRRSLLGI